MRRKMLKRALSVLLAAAMLAVMLPISSMAAGLPFTDVKDSDWFSDAVTQMYSDGYMAGTSATTFSPEGTTDRAMFVTILGRIQGVDKEAYKGKAEFTDVKSGWDWAEPYIAWAAEQGVTSGTGNGLFEPGRKITRQESAALLFRFLNKVGGCDMTADSKLLESFADADTIDDFAKAGMEWAVTAKVFNGKDGNLIDPKGDATRAEIAQIFRAFLRACTSTVLDAGASVVKDDASPTGYTATFVFDPTLEKDEDANKLASVSLSGVFNYIDPDKDTHDADNLYTPYEYEAGMWPTNRVPSTNTWGASFPMSYNGVVGIYSVSIPITSGAFPYSYVLSYKDGTDSKTIDDPANPSPCLDNEDSSTVSSSSPNSMVFGHYDPEKQTGSPDIDYVLPVAGSTSQVVYRTYKGTLDDKQDLGIYLPSGYDKDRNEPYKVIYTSHGSGGNETDWFGMGQIKNIMDHIGKDYIVVTMDNSPYFDQFNAETGPSRRECTEMVEKNVMECIIPYVEENFNVSKKAADRAFNGLSYGGRTTFTMFFDCSDEFAYFGAYSSIDSSIYDKMEEIGGWPTEKPFYFSVGLCDTDDRLEDYKKLQKYIAEHKEINNFIDGGILPGSHDWLFWQQAFYTFVGGICWQDEKAEPGASVVADPVSPTGYTAHFVYEPEKGKEVQSVTVSGPFAYVDSKEDVKAEGNAYMPQAYKPGMFPTNHTPATGTWGASFRMNYNPDTGMYTASFPISSGSFAYSYNITYMDGTTEKIADPTRKSPALMNPDSDFATGDVNSSILYGRYDEVKQAGSPNLDYILSNNVPKGKIEWVTYSGSWTDRQGNAQTSDKLDLGVYLPAGYDPDREEPYKVVYTSHGAGGNETDWFGMAHVDNILDNLRLEYVVVTIDNSTTGFDIDNIVENVIPTIEAKYNVSKEASGRAYNGLSAGGAMTGRMFLKYPDKFAYFGSYCGFNDITNLDAKDWPTEPTYYIATGSCDPLATRTATANGNSSGFQYDTFKENLAAKGIGDNVVDGGLIPGSHDWFVWSAAFKTFVTEVCWPDDEPIVPPTDEEGATVTADPESPTGYTARFVYKNTDGNVESVAVSGPFLYIDPSQELKAEGNAYAPTEYKAGMYPSNHAPSTGNWGANIPMEYDVTTGCYSVSFPISSGSYGYGYTLTYKDGTTKKIADPAKPSPVLDNPNSDVSTGDLTSSIVYGKYDAEKQAGSPNLDFVLPSDKPAEEKGTVTYVEYTGNKSDHQDLGIYLPAGYDAEREEPYKVVYTSHGAGGNETDWFGMAHVDNIMDNLGLDYIVVTMDNSTAGYNLDNVIDNIIPYMEANYNVSKDPKDRAFNGLSMGGMTTGRMILAYPDEFGYFASYCGFNNIADLEAKDWPTEPIYYIASGTCDPLATRGASANEQPSGFQYDTFKENLAAKGIGDNVVDGGLLPGSHDWFVWSAAFKTFVTEVCWQEPVAYEPGATVVEDEESPSGYTVHFVYENTDENVESVVVSGPFNYFTQDNKGVAAPDKVYTPFEYEPGMYAANWVPSGAEAFTSTMEYDEATGYWSTSFPITSGSFAYSYNLTYADGTTEKIADPVYGPVTDANPNSTTTTGDRFSSVVIGRYDPVKQAGSPNMDFVLPSDKPEEEKGTVDYVEYKDSDDTTQYLGVYLPAGFDKNREEPYKVVYMTHGGGGNETDWFTLAHVDNIMDNLDLDYIVVTMNNSYLQWNDEKVGNNMMNHIIPFVEENYNASTNPNDRAFAGLSAGADATFNMFFSYPTEFGYFGAFSGTRVIDGIKDFENIDKPTFYFNVGACDIASALVMPNPEGRKMKYEDFVAYLQENPMDNVIDGGYILGAHDWFEWSQSFHYFVTEVCWQ